MGLLLIANHDVAASSEGKSVDLVSELCWEELKREDSLRGRSF